MTLTPFEIAEHSVKIGHFTRKGYQVTGVVHVGANDGYEIGFYFQLGARRVIAFEPLEKAFNLLAARWLNDARVAIFPFALGEEQAISRLRVTQGDGQGSSLLKEIGGPYTIEAEQLVPVVRFDSLGMGMFLPYANTLVVDTQGMEMQVLRGFGKALGLFDFLNIECSRLPLYEGSYPAEEVVAYLDSQGFQQDTPICDHDDIMFVRRVRLEK